MTYIGVYVGKKSVRNQMTEYLSFDIIMSFMSFLDLIVMLWRILFSLGGTCNWSFLPITILPHDNFGPYPFEPINILPIICVCNCLDVCYLYDTIDAFVN